MERVVLWIDEEPDAIQTFLDDVEECFGPEITVIAEEPQRDVEDMLARIRGIGCLVGLVLDERLRETGKANYTGMELTAAVRRFDSKLPVYILTNHAADIGDEDHQVEYVLDKEEFLDPAGKQRIASRVRRQTSLYHDILIQRESRYEALLRKSLAEPLSEAEQKEFSDLHFFRGKAVLASEAAASERIRAQLDENQTILDELERELHNLEE